MAAAAAVLLALWFLAPVAASREGASPDAVVAASSALRNGVLAALVGLIAIASLAETRRANGETQRANRAAHRRDLDAQLNQRYTQAIGQLGDERRAVRCGGVHALELLAEDSPRHHGRVVDVLSTYIRDTTTCEPASDSAGELPRGTSGPSADVQAALTVLGRLPAREGINRADLAGAVIPHADLRRADLTGVILDRANLVGVRLNAADLTDARLEGADLTCAHLDAAMLISTSLAGATLSRAWFDGADMSDTFLYGADLTGAHLRTARHLLDEQLDGTFGDDTTQLAAGTIRPADWRSSVTTGAQAAPEVVE